MPIITAPGAPVTSIRRMFEAYTLTRSNADDNDANFVTVADITGRGILVSIGANNETNGRNISVQITIDGVTVNQTVVRNLINSFSDMYFIGFETDCKVEMKLSAAGAAKYRTAALVE